MEAVVRAFASGRSFLGPPPPDATYRYSGNQDDDGNAIFGTVIT
jgi:hypothetical protein